MIINSLLDTDFYQFTQSQLIWLNWHKHMVTYDFRNRTFEVPLADCLDLNELNLELEHVRTLKFQEHELMYLGSTGLFSPEYLGWLSNLNKMPEQTLPPVYVGNDNGHLTIRYTGPWAMSVFWETMVLSIVSELYYRRFDASEVEGIRRLKTKIEYLKNRPDIRFVEFGSRRRYSASWQAYITTLLQYELNKGNEVAQLLGTSNVGLAMHLGLHPIGTMAHQLFMVKGAQYFHHEDFGNNNPLILATLDVMDLWKKTYPTLQTILPDTWGTRWFLDTMWMTGQDVWPTWRQDSGDPIHFGEQLEKFLREQDFSPGDHNIVFSDGLDVRTMSVLSDRFKDTFGHISFGWGTNLTNDLGFQNLSLVIKPSFVNGAPCVKLSDNAAKAIGLPKEVEHYKRLTGYSENFTKAAVY